MIKIKQERNLLNGFRALNIEQDNVKCRKDVLVIKTPEGYDFNMDIEKDGTISVWSNSLELQVDTEA